MTLELLQPDFRAKVEELLSRLATQGIRMVPYCTQRTPWEQARLWRQSRSSAQIAVTTQRLRQQGAPRIARCIDEVGAQHGKPVTNAAPGYSHHQYGNAVDCFLVNRDGDADWDASAAGYIAYARVAKELGLRAGRDWGDSPHVQFYHHEPHHDHTPAQLEVMLCERYPAFAALAGKGT